MNFKKSIVFSLHRALTRLRIHLVPVHYYSPVANLLHLESNTEEWARRSEMPGIEWNGLAQLQLMRETCGRFMWEYNDNREFADATCSELGPGYGPIEAQALYAFVRHHKPKKIVEVGSGVSTGCMLAATDRNSQEDGHKTSITCVEPFPRRGLKDLHSQGRVKLIERSVVTVQHDLFEGLCSGDMLFIDSSHTVKPGSDVNFLILEILPRLKSGVLVHLHDIYFPYDYSPLTLRTLWHWNETSLLRAYMTHNPRIRTLFCMSLMHHDHADAMKEIFPSYDPAPMRSGLIAEEVGPMGYPKRHFPCSIYLQIA